MKYFIILIKSIILIFLKKTSVLHIHIAPQEQSSWQEVVLGWMTSLSFLEVTPPRHFKPALELPCHKNDDLDTQSCGSEGAWF